MGQFMTSLKCLHTNTKGNIFALLFAAVGLTGVLGVVGMQTVSGPVKTITKVTQKNITDTDVITNGRILILNATVRPENDSGNGAYDGDPEFEAAPQNTTCSGTPTGGGCLPTTIGTVLTDPWGTNYGYCTWNHGVVRTGVADTLNGRTDTDGYVIAVISAGPNKTFDTTCAAYDDNATRASDVGGISPSIGSGMRVGTTDDIAKAWSYAEAKANSGGLWSESGASGATIDRDLTIGSTVSVNRTTGLGSFLGLSSDIITANAGSVVEIESGQLRLGNNTDIPNGECGGAGDAGTMRWNASGNVDVCDGTSFINVSTAGAEPWRAYDGDNTWVSTETTSGADDNIINMTTNGVTRLTISATGLVDIIADANVGGDLDVTGDLTVTGDDITMTTNTLGAVLVADGTNFNPVVMSGDVAIIADGTATIANNAITGAKVADDTLDFDDFSDTMSLDASTSIAADGAEVLSIVNTGTGNSFVVDDGATQFVIDEDGDVSIGRDFSVANEASFSGNVDLGNANTDNINVLGTIILGAGSACSAPGDAGKIEYSAGTLRYCNGTSWQSASAPAKLVNVGNVNNGLEIAGNDGYVLVWDNGTSEWIAANPSGLSTGTATDSDNALQLIDGTANDDDTWVRVAADNGSDNDTIRFAIDTDADNIADEIMRISNAGIVGIGTGATIDTSAKLQIDSTTSGFLGPRMTTGERNLIGTPATGLMIYNTSTNTFDFWNGTIWTSFASSAGGSLELIDGTANDDDTWVRVAADNGSDNDTIRFAIDTDADNIADEIMRISNAGIVGIGTGATIDTSAKLQIDSTTSGFLGPRMTTGERNLIGTPATGLMIYNTSTNTFDFWNGTIWTSFASSAGGSLELIDGAANDDDTWIRVAADNGSDNDTIRFAIDTDADNIADEIMRISNAGFVGINNPAPDVELDVTGDIEYSGTITDVSDRRLKTDIHELSNADMIDRLSKIKTYEFKMKDDTRGRVEFGVMAQELEFLFPELVHTAKDDMATKSVNYMGLIAPMIEVSKALKAENDKLKADLAALQNDTGAMKASLTTMQSQIHTLNKGVAVTTRGASFMPYIFILFGFIGGALLMLYARNDLSNKYD